MDPNENTPAEIYANIRDRALEEAAALAERQNLLYMIPAIASLAQSIRALKSSKETE